MKPSINLILAAAGALLVASCYPYPENKPQHRHKPNPELVKKEAEEKAKADELKKKEEEAKKKAGEEEEKNKEKEGEKIKERDDTTTGGGEIDKPIKDKPTYEVAKKAPGKEGFVLSPYNNKLIDVRGIASGTLVQDPTYPKSEKKYFRVP